MSVVGTKRPRYVSIVIIVWPKRPNYRRMNTYADLMAINTVGVLCKAAFLTEA